MNVLDLFSGIGVFSLGLERAGMRTVAFCEIEPYCRAVLAKHWPGVPIYDDVRTLTAQRLCADGVFPEVICGGFPCQDISTAGKGVGLGGERSGLWREFSRLVGEIRPRYVIVENVSALLGRGLHRVVGDLAALGYDAEWSCIPASAVGAPHRRDRIWIVAYPASLQCDGGEYHAGGNRQGARKVPKFGNGCGEANVADAAGKRQPRQGGGLMSGAVQRRKAKGKQISLSQSVSEISGALNPLWVEWLMGFPPHWTDLQHSETPSSRNSQNLSEPQ